MPALTEQQVYHEIFNGSDVPDVEQVASNRAAEQLPRHCAALDVHQQLPHEAVIPALVRFALPDTLQSMQHCFLEHN